MRLSLRQTFAYSAHERESTLESGWTAQVLEITVGRMSEPNNREGNGSGGVW